MHTRRCLLPLPALLLAPSAARSQDPAARRYTVLSEIGRTLQVVVEQPQIGSKLPQNLVQQMPVPGGALDRLALSVAKLELLKAQPAATATSFQPLDTDVFDPGRSFTPGSASGMPADLADALRQQRSTHLLLLSRWRAEAAIQMLHAKVGHGQIEGLGFYIDTVTDIDHKDGDVSLRRGYLAPFAYLRASLIDAASGQVLATRTYQRAMPQLNTRGDGSTHPWDGLDNRRKVQLLAAELERALQDLVPALLAAPAPATSGLAPRAPFHAG